MCHYSNKRLDAAANSDHVPDPGILTGNFCQYRVGAIVRILRFECECKLI